MPVLTSTSFKITYNEAQQCLIVNGWKLPLGHMERALAWSLVVQYAARETDQADDRLVSLSALCQATGVPLHRLKHLVSEVRSLLLPHELDIKSVRGEGYYLKLPKGTTLICKVINSGTHHR